MKEWVQPGRNREEGSGSRLWMTVKLMTSRDRGWVDWEAVGWGELGWSAGNEDNGVARWEVGRVRTNGAGGDRQRRTSSCKPKILVRVSWAGKMDRDMYAMQTGEDDGGGEIIGVGEGFRGVHPRDIPRNTPLELEEERERFRVPQNPRSLIDSNSVRGYRACFRSRA